MKNEPELKISSEESCSKASVFKSIVVKTHGISLIILSFILLFWIFWTAQDGYNTEVFIFLPLVFYSFSYGLFYYKRSYEIKFSSILNNISIIFFIFFLISFIALLYSLIYNASGGWPSGLLEYAISIITFPISFLLSTIYIIRESSSIIRRFMLYGFLISILYILLVFIFL